MKKKTAIIAVDVGTTFIKAGAYDIMGELLAAAVRKTRSETPLPDAFIQYGGDFLEGTVETIRETVEKLGQADVQAIGFTGQMAGMIGIDCDFNPVTIWSGTIDNRQLKYAQELTSQFGDRILTLSGTNSPLMSSKILWVKREFPEQYKAADRFLILSGYIIGCLAGLKSKDAFIDRTYLTWTGLADLKNDSWSEELCSYAGIPADKLPEIVPGNSIVGRLIPEYAEKCGLPSGIPLIAGAGDKPAGCLGAGVFEPGMIADESSSVGALSFCVDSFEADRKYKTLEIVPSAIPGQYFALSYLTGSGFATDWFVNTLAPEYVKEAEKREISVFELLDEKASSIPPGAGGITSISLLGGRALPLQPYVKGMFLGYNWTHTIPHFYRAFQEGMAYEFGYFLSVMKATYPGVNPVKVRAIGGGANSQLFCGIKSDVLGLPYETLVRNDASLLGTALLAGNAAGVFKDLKRSSREIAKIKSIIEPDKGRHEFYLERNRVYIELLDRMSDIYHLAAM